MHGKRAANLNDDFHFRQEHMSWDFVFSILQKSEMEERDRWLKTKANLKVHKVNSGLCCACRCKNLRLYTDTYRCGCSMAQKTAFHLLMQL